VEIESSEARDPKAGPDKGTKKDKILFGRKNPTGSNGSAESGMDED
jgi:hypothetical protein